MRVFSHLRILIIIMIVNVRVNKFYIENSLKELMNNEISLIFH